MQQSQSEYNWYALYTKPRAEKKVNLLLQQKGIESYLPVQTTLKQWSDRKRKVEEPLFKSYIFVRIPYDKEHTRVLQTAGIVKFVRHGKELAVIRDAVIDAVKLTLAHYTEIETTNEQLAPDQPVRILAGPLKGMEGVVTQQHGNHYFAIRIEELGTHVLIKVPAAYLQPL